MTLTEVFGHELEGFATQRRYIVHFSDALQPGCRQFAYDVIDIGCWVF